MSCEGGRGGLGAVSYGFLRDKFEDRVEIGV